MEAVHYQSAIFKRSRPVQPGITDMMLSQSLKELERDLVINRVQYNVIPPRVEYSLTENGMGLSIAVQELAKWGNIQLDRNV